MVRDDRLTVCWNELRPGDAYETFDIFRMQGNETVLVLSSPRKTGPDHVQWFELRSFRVVLNGWGDRGSLEPIEERAARTGVTVTLLRRS